MKKWLVMVLSVMVILSLSVGALAADETDGEVTVEKKTAGVGEEVNLEVRVTSAKPVMAFSFGVVCGNELELIAIEPGECGDISVTEDYKVGWFALKNVEMQGVSVAVLKVRVISVPEDGLADVMLDALEFSYSPGAGLEEQPVNLGITTGGVEVICNHNWDAGKVTKAPTCTEKGIKTFTCTICTNSKTEEIPSLGHKQNEGEVTKPATCQAAGEKVYKCTECGEVIKTEPIAKLEHKEDKGTVTKEASCTETGEKVVKCTVGGEILRTETIPALGHQWDEGKIVKEAEEGQPGLKIYTCLNDETHTREEEIPAIEEKTELPDVVGMTIDEALEVLESLGLTTPIRVTPDASMDKDAPLAPDCVVTEMVPAAGEMITKDTEIKLTIKAPEGEDPANPVDGPATPPVEDLKKVVLPNVVGKNIEDSSGAIANLGLKWEWPQGIPSDINYVITEMKPAAGETVPEGTVVQLFYTTEISKTSESTPEAASPATPAADVPTAPAATPVAPAMGDPTCIALWVSLLLGSGGTAMLFGKKRG